MAYIPTPNPRIEELIEGLEHDRQLRDDPSLKAKIKRLLEAQVKPREGGRNPFAPNAVIKQQPKPKTTQTPIEKIREKNRYIK
jgi:hypothetical protein